MSNPANPQCAPAWNTTPEIKEAMKHDQYRATVASSIRLATEDTLKPGETPVHPRKRGIGQAILRWLRARAG